MSDPQLAPDAAAAAAHPLRWYVVHAYSGMEKAVERNLKERIDRSELQSKFGRILVPMEEVVELKNGKKSVSERRFFPGYVLVEMLMDDETWHLVKHTSKVTGFVGGAKNRPAPISEAEVMKIVNQMQEGIEKPRPKVEWVVGEPARQGRPVHRLQRQRRGSELREVQGARQRHHLRPVDAGRAGFRAGREGLSLSLPRHGPGDSVHNRAEVDEELEGVSPEGV
jgi:transcriptional antiterminator NusG